MWLNFKFTLLQILKVCHIVTLALQNLSLVLPAYECNENWKRVTSLSDNADFKKKIFHYFSFFFIQTFFSSLEIFLMIIFDEEFGDGDWISYDIIYKNAETNATNVLFMHVF